MRYPLVGAAWSQFIIRLKRLVAERPLAGEKEVALLLRRSMHDIVQQICKNDLDEIDKVMSSLLNVAMQIEHEQRLVYLAR